jgi:hypothetical protein
MAGYTYAANRTTRAYAAVQCSECGKYHNLEAASFLVVNEERIQRGGTRAQASIHVSAGFDGPDRRVLLEDGVLDRTVLCRSRQCAEKLFAFLTDEFDDTYLAVVLDGRTQFEQNQKQIPDKPTVLQTEFADYDDTEPLPRVDTVADITTAHTLSDLPKQE